MVFPIGISWNPGVYFQAKILVSGSVTIFGAINFSQPAAYDDRIWRRLSYPKASNDITPAALHVGIFLGGKGYEGLNWGRYREGRLSIY